ncbi:hypothetical protein HPP92_020307 [Vanilla planifolia]|uniref:Uncharacterized protein n=1 Tax=Vanilla planifolia TaxID=51239 RepID=A0A835Q874_VANPL|nr:hypothetical protein HPP92_020307 [Vanilla planifolia]
MVNNIYRFLVQFSSTVKTSCADPALLDPPPPGTRRSSCKPPNPVSLSEDAKATDEQIWSSKSSRFPSPSRQNPIASAAGIQFDNFRAPCSVRIWIVRWSLDSPLCSVAGVSGCPAPVDGEFERGIEEKEPLKWITMPGLIQRGAQFGHAPATACSALSGPAGSLHVSSAIWSRQQDDVSFDQLKKFWGEMQVDARRQLLRVDKQTVLEQARRNLYCSRCHGLLLQCYSQIVIIRGRKCAMERRGRGSILKEAQVFDSAQHREHDRELLYPDACGDGGRSWISQGSIAKRFCRDCRRNVLREFKELKELKRLKKELHCTRWFCISDTSIQYELSNESVQADWQHSFTDTHKYHHFEWAIGTAEGKTDILEFENVGLNEKVQANGLNLRHLSACFITVRAWKLDGRCIEICVKAHALKGQACVHRRLIVGDGFVSITKGDSIRSFFEHAEEIEEEEDDDYVDKDGNELDGDGSRPQKHAKSPELMREFLLDTATVIFKEQVEKAFREGTTRQNAHILFVSLAIKLLEEQLHVACKEIISIQKQIKLLEEEKMKSVRKMSAGRGGEQRAGKETKKEGTAGKKERSSGKQNQFNLRNLIPQNLDSKPSIEKMAYARVTQVVQSHMRHDTNLPVTSREMNIWHDCGLKNSSMSLTRGTKTNRERVVRQSDKSFIDVRFIKKSHSSMGKVMMYMYLNHIELIKMETIK